MTSSPTGHCFYFVFNCFLPGLLVNKGCFLSLDAPCFVWFSPSIGDTCLNESQIFQRTRYQCSFTLGKGLAGLPVSRPSAHTQGIRIFLPACGKVLLRVCVGGAGTVAAAELDSCMSQGCEASVLLSLSSW